LAAKRGISLAKKRNMQLEFKKLRIDILAIVGFAIVSLLFCYPQLQGKKLSQHDNISWQGMAHEAMAYHDSTGKDVLWSNSMFGGMPTYTTYVGATSTNYVAYIQAVLQVVGKPAYFFFIAMLCFYIFMRVLGVNKWVGIVGAIAYAFSSYNAIIIQVGHDTKMLTLGYLPAAMAGMYLVFKEKWLTGAALLGVTFTLIFSNNHFQVIFYSFIIFGCFAVAMLFVALKEGRIKQYLISCAVAAVTTVIGISPTLTSLLTTNEYAKETMRGGASELSGHDKKTNGGLDKEYAFRWSNGIGETFCILVPYLYGGSSGESAEKAPKTSEAIGGKAEELPLYWGPQPFVSGPVYFGAVVCFLFVLGIMVIRSPHKWWIIAASAIGIMLSWGSNFESINYFLFDHVPYLNKFRTPSMALVIPQFLFPVLGIWALQEILDRKNDPKLWKQVMMAAGITAGLCLLVGVGGSIFFSFTGGEDSQLQPEMVKLLRDDRASLASSSGLKSAAYILITAGLIWAFLKNRINQLVLIICTGIIIVIDLVPVSLDYLNEKSYVDASEYDNIFQPREVDKQILRDPDPYYRVLDLSRNTYNDAEQAYFHKCIGGYHPAKMEIYQDLIDRQMSKGFNGQVLNMLNTKYIIFGGQKRPPAVIPNPRACGNAWFVREVKWAATADEEMNGLNAPDIQDTAVMPGAFDPKNTAVMRDMFKADMGNYTFGKDSTAYVKLDKYGLDDITFKSSNSKDGLAVFSDIYYSKGWKAYVDGKETPILKADYVLRAIKIPAGNHNIEFHFRPASFYNGQKVAFAGSLLLIGLCLAALYPLVKKGKA
jgi:hypothetical protein